MFGAILDDAIKVRYAGIRDAAAKANGIAPFDVIFGRDYPPIGLQRAQRAQRLMKLIERSKRRFPRAWKPLSSRLKSSPHFSARAKLAEFRVVSPLFDWEDSSGIERSGSELTDKEL